VRIRVDPRTPADAGALTRAALVNDGRAGWVQRLFSREYLMGTSLSAARAEDDDVSRLDAKLRYLVQHARRVPYYRDLPAVQGISELNRLPILDKADLEAHSLPRSRDMTSAAAPSGELLRSGASSGSPRYVMYSGTDWANMVREAVPLFYALGLGPGDRLINAMFCGPLYGSLTTTISEFSRMPVECYTTGQFLTDDYLVMLADQFGANAILGQPPLIMPVLRGAKSRRPGLRMEKVLYGGTPMAEPDKRWLREQLGTRVISSVLAANDGAQLGYQCDSMSGTLHHVCDDYNLIEVVDEAGDPVPDGTCGELLITTMQKFEGPLIRYRIGDQGRVFRYDCDCGVSGRALEYLGRSDGVVKVGGYSLAHRDILAALADLRVSQVQLEVGFCDQTQTVVIRTESPAELEPAVVLDQLRLVLGLWGGGRLIRDDSLRITVECLGEGQLARNAVSGKIKPIIDRRLVDTKRQRRNGV
jgi:phenylacetate-coenzyme A ligase PaaK-like adenylate-forming protein